MPQPRVQSKRKEENDLYINWEDRKRLEALPEVEREEILYERYMTRLKEKERKEIEQRVKSFGEESEEDTKDLPEKAFPRSSTLKSSFEIFKYILLRRDTFLKLVYRRAISQLVGYYVKIRLPTGYSIYRIDKIEEAKRYEVSGVVTNKWLSLSRKKDRKEVAIESISNSPPTEEEYEEYVKDNSVPGDREAIKLWKRLTKEIETEPTNDEANYSLSQKRRFLRHGKVVAKRRIELKTLLSKAKEEGNTKEIKRLEEEINDMGQQ
ncbi:hypothetical protein NEFER03_0685 [Nematocida sp. LUAm3]|nr:hypothetical protein NEFER03_0685 [Nematocida sp. LUAm3]KAI5175144.1 hypothetical protein NEFER02_1105 [Nematocida sp. LUAm2]KAI5178184.1 hypothetical protein NEFER01_1362 [Nematocida sp. LUAm1]